MENGTVFLCSQLMRVSSDKAVTIGNVEEIYPDGCTITLDVPPPPIGAQIRMRCISCPLGKKSCTDCKFKGRIRCHENDPVLGCLIHVEFEGRAWSAEEWHPQHLTNVEMLISH